MSFSCRSGDCYGTIKIAERNAKINSYYRCVCYGFSVGINALFERQGRTMPAISLLLPHGTSESSRIVYDDSRRYLVLASYISAVIQRARLAGRRLPNSFKVTLEFELTIHHRKTSSLNSL